MEASWVQNGIQLLLATEQEAQQIVNTARNSKPLFLFSILSSFLKNVRCLYFFFILIVIFDTIIVLNRPAVAENHVCQLLCTK